MCQKGTAGNLNQLNKTLIEDASWWYALWLYPASHHPQISDAMKCQWFPELYSSLWWGQHGDRWSSKPQVVWYPGKSFSHPNSKKWKTWKGSWCSTKIIGKVNRLCESQRYRGRFTVNCVEQGGNHFSPLTATVEMSTSGQTEVIRSWMWQC